MTEIFLSILGGAAGAALITGIMSIVMYRMKRKDEKKDEQDENQDVVKKALRYVMLYIIQERCKEHIRAGEISLEELRLLHHWHTLYHDGLNGNGDAKALLEQVEHLPLITD